MNIRPFQICRLAILLASVAFSAGVGQLVAAQGGAATGNKVVCVEGSAGGYDCNEVNMLSILTPQELGSTETCGTPGKDRFCDLNDIWGWTDPDTGNEYALVGMEDGTAFVNISDPYHPIFLGSLPHNGVATSLWRDIKTYKNYAYIVADSRGGIGIQVFDLRELGSLSSSPRTFAATYEYPEDRTSLTSAHNIVINEETGFAYVVGSHGSRSCGRGLHMVDLVNPARPEFAGCFALAGTGRAFSGYTHDAQCVIYNGPDQDHFGREICISANETHVVIADVTDKGAPFAISSATYPNSSYIHQGWLTEDHRYYLQNDEGDERTDPLIPKTRTLIWDVIDLDDPVLVKEYFGPNRTVDHNLYIKGNLVFESNYVDGIRIIDITDILNPVEIAHFDTHPDDLSVFDGTWSNYPFFESGVVVVSSSVDGLFLLEPTVPGWISIPDSGGSGGGENGNEEHEESETPIEDVILEAYPNPFSDFLTIVLGVTTTQHLTVTVHDMLGRTVKTIYSGVVSGGGEYRLAADFDDLPAGIYFYRATGENFTISKPITRMK